jgi:GNAT superfamily N-acetyltransferase
VTRARSAWPFADVVLARRLERAEAHANAQSVMARARLWPESGAAWIDVRGAYAMFDGVDSPITQTFGLGLFDEVRSTDLEQVEQFFGQHGAPSFHEVSPLAGVDLAALLGERGYRPFEFTSVMFRPVATSETAGGVERSSPLAVTSRVAVRVATPDDEETWTETAATGWSEHPEAASFMRDIGRLSMARPDATCFLAELDGQPIATALLSLHEGVALFAGASTVPASRGQGAQLALLDARLRYAAAQGCDLAMMCALPGSASQRNAERHGFRIAYTRMKYRR